MKEGFIRITVEAAHAMQYFVLIRVLHAKSVYAIDSGLYYTQ